MGVRLLLLAVAVQAGTSTSTPMMPSSAPSVSNADTVASATQLTPLSFAVNSIAAGQAGPADTTATVTSTAMSAAVSSAGVPSTDVFSTIVSSTAEPAVTPSTGGAACDAQPLCQVCTCSGDTRQPDVVCSGVLPCATSLRTGPAIGSLRLEGAARGRRGTWDSSPGLTTIPAGAFDGFVLTSL